jgi:mono/diheme cytochrome c family protein
VVWVFALPDSSPNQVPRPVRAEVPTRSVAEGVFTAAQAARGEQVYTQHCTGCHAVGNYAGQALLTKWGSGRLSDIYRDIATSMPPANPGGLSAGDYAAIVAYFLRETGYTMSAADEALPGDSFQLNRFVIDVPGSRY